MSELALRLIAENKRTKAPFLDLGNCGLEYELPEELLDCVWLERLNLGDIYFDKENKKLTKTSNNRWKNRFEGTELVFLRKLTALQTLDLRSNQIFDIRVLENLTALQSLNLSNNNISDIRGLEKLTELQHLDLRENHISNIIVLENLIGLQYLDLSSNYISDIRGLENLTALQSLNLSLNKISDIRVLENLTALQSLNLYSNQISDIQVLENLKALQSLNLISNHISDIRGLEKLTALQSLHLSSNQISDIRVLENLTALQSLGFSSNQTSDIRILKNLTGLQSLELSYNQINDIGFLKNLTALQFLDLSFNHISDIRILENLTALQSLHLSENQINDLKSLLPLLNNGLEIDLENEYSWDLEGKIGLKDNPIVNPPLSIVKKGRGAVIRYFENELETKYEGKLLIVGEPEAGKTTLRNRLVVPNYKVPNDTTSTVGIQVEKWLPKYPKSRSKTMQVNVWDFGGQEIQYLTHQFFLTSDALYVLLTSARKDLDNLDYWFNIIRLLGKNENNQHSKLLVVANEIKMEPVTHFVERDFKERYPDLDFECLAVNFATSQNKDGRFKSLQFKITENLARLPSMGRQLPVKWGIVRKKLEEKRENSISIEKYLEICTDAKLDEKSAYDLSAYLHTIGEAIHFQNDYKVDDFIILKPKWAVDGVYVVLKEESVKKNGHFTQQQVYKIWHKNGYSKEECNRLLRLMAKDNFEVSYPLPEGTGEYIAPQLLPEKQPAYEWRSENSLKFRYSYSFMPKGIITRFIVRLHEDIEYQDGEGIVWKNGVVLKDKYTGTMAQVREMKVAEKGLERKVIDIEVIGAKGERKSLLKKVCRTIEKIHNEAFSGLPFERLVPCNCPDCIGKEEVTFYDYSELVKRYERGRNIDCKKDLREVKINDIFEEIIDLDATAKTRTFLLDKRLLDKEIAVQENFSDPFNAVQKERTIFFSYAWGDEKETGESREKIVNELYDSLKSDSYDVIRDKVDLGYKGLISDFMSQIGKGKTVIVAMTDKYFKSPYCMFELYEVYRNSRFEKEEFKEKIYPIRVESIAFDDNKVMADYLSYWKTKKKEKEALVRDFLDNVESEQFKEFEKIKNISLKFMEMITILKDMNALTKDLLSKDNFAEIKKAIEQKASKA